MQIPRFEGNRKCKICVVKWKIQFFNKKLGFQEYIFQEFHPNYRDNYRDNCNKYSWISFLTNEPQCENEDKCPFQSHGCIATTCLSFIEHCTIPLLQHESLWLCSAWKSGPVWFLPFWDMDQDWDQSTKVPIGQKTGLDHSGPVFCSLGLV